MQKLLIVLLLLSLFSLSLGFRKPSKFLWEPRGKIPIRPESSENYETKYYTQKLDHFNFQDKRTYQQRYLVNSQYWGRKNLSETCAGPILLYTGNEGTITDFYDNSGFITDILAPELGGLIVFAEHRYYGDSKPFGLQSFAVENVGYLTTEQALADFATLIRYLKYQSTDYAKMAQNCPVIAFGGSYGGMLSAWLRMKYPNSVAGALASSAPIGWFLGAGVPQLQYVYAKIVTEDYAAVSSQCSGSIAQAFQLMESLGSSSSGRQQLKDIFHLCNVPAENEMESFLSFIEGAFDTMAQYDYPYAATFAGDLPAWPVNAACDQVLATDPSNQTSLLNGIYQAASVYYNSSGQAGNCYAIHNNPDPYGGAWGYQTCTEMVMPYASNGQTDMFFNDPWNYTEFKQACAKRWQVEPQPNWAVLQWGGLNVHAASNIFFSNGILDPYAGGGVLSTLSPSLPAMYIEQSAHHLDLRAPHPGDPASIAKARALERSYIESWIYDYINFEVNHN